MADDLRVGAEECVSMSKSGDVSAHTLESFPNTEVKLGDLAVSRALPVRGRRLVGPWCFLDRFGPMTFTEGKPMDVAPHPHIGLQTVTWLLDGEVLHDDSLGSQAIARPGAVNVMTSGNGIAHTEQTPANNTGVLEGVQLWVALPDEHRHRNAMFESVDRVPVLDVRGGIVRVFSGSLAGAVSPAQHFSELVGADLQVLPAHGLEIDLQPQHEHAVLLLKGDCALGQHALTPGRLHYLGLHRNGAEFRSRNGCRLLLIGGPPFPETILMWWNFVARTPEEIAQARAEWQARERFGDVRAYSGPRLNAPDLLRIARPNPVS